MLTFPHRTWPWLRGTVKQHRHGQSYDRPPERRVNSHGHLTSKKFQQRKNVQVSNLSDRAKGILPALRK